MLVFDIETDGFLDAVTKVHCINVIDRDTGKAESYNGGVYADGSLAPRDGTIEDGLARLAEADALVGHNIIRYDLPVLRKLYPTWHTRARIIDTLVMVNVIYTNIQDRDFAALAAGRLPEEFRAAGLIRSHSLEAWGYRLGVLKGTFNGPWEDFTPIMDKYGRQDPVVNLALLEHLEAKKYSRECIELEHAVAHIIQRQRTRGWAFDVPAAEALVVKLRKRLADLAAQLQVVFPAWTVDLPDFIPKRDNRAKGYKAGVPVKRQKQVVFNPASRQHIADRLIKLRGWKPSKFTDNGQAAVDETVLSALPWPEAKLLADYLLVEKRLGQLADGKEACLKHVRNTGLCGTQAGPFRIHGDVNTNGAVTGRMTHARPNVAQTPKNGSEYGEEFRACYIAAPGHVLVGCDAEGLELRCLAHYMARYDGGAYGVTVVNGKSADGTDVHTVNQRAIGLNVRDNAKTFIYALIYGAGDYKLGTIVYDDFTDEVKARFNAKFTRRRERDAALKNLGQGRRGRLMANLPALGQLIEDVKKAAKRGYLIGLDGRLLHVRSEHSALNTLLQSAGAVIMKKALVTLDEQRVSKALRFEFVGNIHDEWQIEAEDDNLGEPLGHPYLVGQIAADSIRRAGEHFKFRCPLSGSYHVGKSWAATH